LESAKIFLNLLQKEFHVEESQRIPSSIGNWNLFNYDNAKRTGNKLDNAMMHNGNVMPDQKTNLSNETVLSI
jgi:hypothetical protein